MRYLYLLILLFNVCSLVAQEDLSKWNYEELDSLIYLEYDNGDFEKVIQYLEFARKKHKQELGDKDSSYANYGINLAFAYEEMAQYDKAERLYLEAKKIRETVFGKEHAYYAEVIGNLAVLYVTLGRYAEAERLFLEGIKVNSKTISKEDNGYILRISNLAVFYQKIGDYQQSEPLLLEARDLWLKTLGKENPKYAMSLSNLGLLYQKMGSYAQAEPLLLESMNLTAKILGKEHPSYATSLSNLGSLYNEKENYEQAEVLLLEAKNIRAKILGTEHSDYLLILGKLAVLYYEIGKYKEAELLYLESKKTRAKIFGKQHPSYAILLNNLSSVYKAIGDYTQAELLLLESKNILEKTLNTDNLNYGASLNNLASLYFKIGRLEDAMTYCSASIAANSAQIDSGFTDWINIDKFEYYSNNQTYSTVGVLLNILKIQYQKTKDKTILERHYKIAQAAMRLNERIRNNFNNEADKLEALSFNQNYVRQGIETAVLLNQDIYNQEAFSFAELNKSVLLADALKGNRARTLGDLPDTLADKEIALQKRVSELKKEEQNAKTPEEKEALHSNLNTLNQEVNAFLKSLKDKYPKYHALKYENITAKAADVQALLNNPTRDLGTGKTALMEYFLTDSVLYLFVVTPKQVQLFPIPIKIETLKERIKKLRDALSNYAFILKKEDEAYRHYTENAYWFYKEIVEIGLKGKSIENLIIVTDGELGHLPFEAFLTKQAPQKGTYKELDYLVKNYNISYNYSATLFVETQNNSMKQHSNNGQILACAAGYAPVDSSLLKLRLPYFYRLRTHLQPLPAAQMEIAALSENFQGTFLWNDSTNERFFKDEVQHYNIIHLAMHGILDTKVPMYSSLAFTENLDSLEDNFLQAFEIAHLHLNANLVVLSACETGYGKFEQGEGVMSLARSFMYAGVPSLVVSLWQVNDHSTAEIMKGFYQNLADGMNKDAALRKAKMDYIQNAEGVLAHPAFWSPFVQMGDNRPIKVAAIGGWFVWAIGGLVLLIAMTGLWFKFRNKS